MPSIEARKWTHAELCALAVVWLKRMPSAGGHGCQLAISECPSGWNGEIPDAIGFQAAYDDTVSVVVEAKTSRSDFLADRKKPHRAPGQGIGVYRYMMCPEGLISPDELPEGWGLLWVNKRGHIKPKVGPIMAKHTYDERLQALEAFKNARDLKREQWLLIKLLARVGDPEQVSRWLREANRERDRYSATVTQQDAELKTLRSENRRMKYRLEQAETEAA